MAASPEMDALLQIADMHSSPSPPSSPVLPSAHENSPTTAPTPEPAHPDHTTPTPPPPPQHYTPESSDLGESSLPTDGGDLAPSLPPSVAAPSASPALEAASPEKPASPPFCPPDAPVELFPDVSASAALPPPSPQIGEEPSEDAALLLSPPPTPPATTSPRAALESSTTEIAAMASQEAAPPPAASELDHNSAPAPLTPPLESGPEGLSLQQHRRPAGPEMALQVCENMEPAQPPPPQSGSTDVLSDTAADDAVAVASAEVAVSLPTLEAMDGEKDVVPDDVPPDLESEAEGVFPQQQLQPPHPEMAPPGWQNSEPAESQMPPAPAESTYCSLDAVVNEVTSVASEEAAGSPPALDSTGGEVALESQSEGPLQEPMQPSSSPKMEAEPSSPDMAPPGFENFKSKWLPLPAPTLPVESAHFSIEASATDTASGVPEGSAGSLPAMEALAMEMDISPGQLPLSKSAEEGLLYKPLKVSSSLPIEAAPCSPDMPPPGFENFKLSWVPQPTISCSAETTSLPDVLTTKEALVEKSCSMPAQETTDMETDTARNLLPTFERRAGGPQPTIPHSAETTYSLDVAANEELLEKACSMPAQETTDMETDAARNLLPLLESGAGGLLQVLLPTSPSPKMQTAPCSPHMPPGFENLTLPLPAMEALAMEMEISPGQLPSSKSAEEGPLHQPLKVSSSLPIEAAPCSPDTPPPGFENFKLSWVPKSTIPCSAETTYSPDVPTTKEALVKKACSIPAQETTDKETDTARNLLRTFERGAEDPQPDVPTYSPDVPTTKDELVEKACSMPTQDTTDMETDTTQNLLPALESGAGGLLQVPLPTSSSPKMQTAPCSPHMPPGFENLTLPQLQIPSPLAQTSHISQDSAATGAVCLTSEDAPQPSSALEAVDVEMDCAPSLPTSLENGAQESTQQERSRLPSFSVQVTTCSLEMVPSGSDNLKSLADGPDALAGEVITTVTVESMSHPLSVAEETGDTKGHILPPVLENGCEGPLPCLELKVSSPVAQADPSSPEVAHTDFESLETSQPTSPCLAERIDSTSLVPVTKSLTVKPEKTAKPLSPSQATDTDMENATVLHSPLNSQEKSLPQPMHQPSPSGKDVPCSPDIAPPGYENLDSSEELPPPPPLCPNFEMGQMVCGCCRDLIAYPRGATHVQCFGCWTINLVLEAHQVGKVYCGQCETLLMYPFGAPAVRCSTCLFVTEIGERNVRSRMSTEQGTLPPPQELGQATQA